MNHRFLQFFRLVAFMRYPLITIRCGSGACIANFTGGFATEVDAADELGMSGI
jgi:hypothetical protein